MAGQNVVLVNINYRLGVLGFLANEALYVTCVYSVTLVSMKENSTYPSTGTKTLVCSDHSKEITDLKINAWLSSG
jgi:hypothetical protein